ncbi:MAG: NAD-glutamate dehydrogenase [Candidatus Margulisbacteria bacterium]|nr:NAD-glutamate dehydrogenase [Candidatus Margulisiibacteriota bacterium]
MRRENKTDGVLQLRQSQGEDAQAITIKRVDGHEAIKYLGVHIAAVQEVSHSMDAILSKTIDIKQDIKSSNPTTLEPELEPVGEWLKLIDWLKNLNFSFFGYAAFNIDQHKKKVSLIKNSGLGILSKKYSKIDQDQTLNALKRHVVRLQAYPTSFLFDTLNVKSPVQRLVNLLRLSIKIPLGDGKVLEHNIVGLLKRSSLLVKNIETPLINLKIKHVFDAKHMLPGSYDYNEVSRICNEIPKYELFNTPAEILLELCEFIMSITNPNDIYTFTRLRPNQKRFFIMVVMPTALFTKTNINTLMAYIRETIPHSGEEVIRIYSEEKSRLHIYLDIKGEKEWQPDISNMEIDIRDKVKPWEERVKDLLIEH